MSDSNTFTVIQTTSIEDFGESFISSPESDSDIYETDGGYMHGFNSRGVAFKAETPVKLLAAVLDNIDTYSLDIEDDELGSMYAALFTEFYEREY